jgi:hypothetical protein
VEAEPGRDVGALVTDDRTARSSCHRLSWQPRSLSSRHSPGHGCICADKVSGSFAGTETGVRLAAACSSRVQRALSTGVVWTGVGDPVDLPIPAGDQYAMATVITDHGTVGGAAFTAGFELQPVLWSCR